MNIDGFARCHAQCDAPEGMGREKIAHSGSSCLEIKNSGNEGLSLELESMLRIAEWGLLLNLDIYGEAVD